MSVYFNLFYRKKKDSYSRNDELNVQVYYYYQKQKLNVSTGVSVKIKDWDDNWEKNHRKNPVKKSDPEFRTKNILIKQKVKEVEEIVNTIQFNNHIPTVDLVKSHLRQNNKTRLKESLKELDFLFVLDLYKKHIQKDVVLRKNYKKSVKSSLKTITDFVYEEYGNKTKLLISDIDEDFQHRFLNYLSGLGHQPSTIRKRMKSLVSMINWSRENNYTEHQIKLIKFNHNHEKDVIFLQRDEVLKLYNFKDFNYRSPNHRKYTFEYITDYLRNGKSVTYTNWEVYRDMIVFGCGVGCRYGDLVKLKLDNYEFTEDRTHGYFVFRMEKSRVGKQVRVPINNLTFQIWKKYSKNKKRENFLFPRGQNGKPIFIQKVNKHIKEIGKTVGLNRLVSKPKFDVGGKIIEGSDTRVPLYSVLTSHIIRRTFIREGIENKIPTHILMSMSGHTTEQVFKRYYSTTKSELDKEGQKMFSLDLKGNTEKKEENQSGKNDLETELKKLKTLFEKGLIPEKIYIQKVSELI